MPFFIGPSNLPSYKGEPHTLAAFKEKISRTLELVSLSPTQQVQLLLGQLEGPAAEEMRSWPATEKADVQQILARLSKEFEVQSPTEVRLKFYDRRPGRDSNVTKLREIFSRSGSDVRLSPRYKLTIDGAGNRCDEFIWSYNGSSQLIRLSRGKKCREPENDYNLFSNYNVSEDGHLTLINVPRNNTGIYTVEVFGSGGEARFTDIYTLHVQDPVSELLLNVSCLLGGGADIFCRTINGSDPWFSIIVNGDVILENATSSSIMGNVREVHVTVPRPGPWDITCSVRNRVSDREISKTGEKCPVPLSMPILEGSCLHDGSREVICSVENGTDPVFSLSVNETLLENVRKEKRRVNVTLSSPGPWMVHCSVGNSIGEKINITTFLACPAPPSAPVLEGSCLHDGSREVFCSVENGTDPVFSLSVNETLLENVRKEKRRVNVTLTSPGPWMVHCSVRNNLGGKNNTRRFPACEVPLFVPVINASCYHNGSTRVICLVEEGSNATYHWTVNGKFFVWNAGPDLTVNSSEFLSGAINISCSAENTISKEQSNVTSINCGDSSGSSCLTCLQKSIIGGMVALFVTTSPLLIAWFYNRHNKKED
ncbi:uncharacterized protein [Dendropsophus ebraccatus]|uniref:uncharacterized protein n=1 Tax=Dendropsophus ebraccatus TaxID=150705 RepID=UPI003831AC35